MITSVVTPERIHAWMIAVGIGVYAAIVRVMTRGSTCGMTLAVIASIRAVSQPWMYAVISLVMAFVLGAKKRYMIIWSYG